MSKLKRDLKGLCDRNRDGSYAAQMNRHRILQQIANTLIGMGFFQMTGKSLKPKHVEALTKSYLEAGLSTGTIKNRLATLRWWAEKIDKRNVIAKDNAVYGIGSREFVTNVSKAKELDSDKVSQITCPYVQMSLKLQKAFGLRRQEAIKFIPIYADQGDFIQLKPSWTKGGKARKIPVKSEEQRDCLNQARSLAGKASLIPKQLSYIEQLKIYERETAKVGLSKLHGLRHRYAQLRYKSLTGRLAPNCGGKHLRELNPEERLKDQSARLIISKELGHERAQIVAVYAGR